MAVHDDKSKRLTEELSAYMEENNLSKSDVARLLKMTPGSLGNYMEGIANVGRRIEERLSQLGIDVFYIKTGYKEENITEKKTSRYGTGKSQNNKVSERLSTYAKKGTKTKDVLIRSLLNENTLLRNEIDTLRSAILEHSEAEE